MIRADNKRMEFRDRFFSNKVLKVKKKKKKWVSYYNFSGKREENYGRCQ